MGNRFAGAADAGQRRRRRLASPQSTNADATDVPAAVANPLRSEQLADSRLLRRAISPRLWKHVSILAAIVAALTVLLWNSASESTEQVRSLIENVSGILLLLAAQLAAVIGWIRSRSEVDFQGQYRWWKRLATVLGVASLLLLTGRVTAIPDIVTRILEPLTGTISAARYTVVLVPSLAGAAILLSRILPDMNRCLHSQSLMVAAVLAVIVRIMLTYGTAGATIHEGVYSVLAVFSSFCAFASMLLHCRFVAFVCHDPPDTSRLGIAADG